ncbi:haloacid dehalogenase superfamily, subfamily IA, variant 1 with third motif having Dx(3-4)D or Dx(3-4)E [Streptomyces sp. LamerLS-316]|nr:haloacid dehalogenase superfamily, subfamily IA, variant 1 with third motif having Dx(3-4)D or Dx(3-4)E [Streptomyces sp. LamerLS-316]
MKTIVFDIGETLVRDDRLWASWADWLGVPPHTVSALVGAAVAQGRDATDALRVLRPGMDVGEAYQARAAAGRGEHLDETDLYPDVRPALAELRALGLRVVVAGDRTARAGELLRALDLPADLVVTSEEWGVAKPDREFFARVLEVSGASPESTLYVGDHPADDLFPAKSCGLRAAHIRRGPYGHWWADHPDVLETADWRVSALTELPALLGGTKTKRRPALTAPPERATVPEQTGPAAPLQEEAAELREETTATREETTAAREETAELREETTAAQHDSAPQEQAAPPRDDDAPSEQARA